MENHLSNPYLPTGISGLDSILYGGLLEGNVILLEGLPGTGKTTIGMEFLYRGATQFNECGLIVSFEMSRSKIIRDAAGLGWDFERLEKEGKLKIVILTPEVLAEELGNPDGTLFREIRTTNAKRVFVDGLLPLKHYYSNTKSISFREALHSLITKLHALKVTALFTTEILSASPLGESGTNHEQYLCDTIITLRNQAQRRSVHRSIEISKSRGQAYIGGRHSLKIEPGVGVQVYPRIYARPNVSAIQPTSNTRSTVGIPVLDSMLGGGIYDGSVTLMVGISGTGKTVAGMQFLMEGIKLGKKALLVTLDEHTDQILRNATSLGIDLQAARDKGDLIVLFDSPLELDIDEHFYRIQEIVEKNNIERVVIDSLAAYESSQLEESYDFTIALAAYFKQNLIAAMFNFECPELLGVSQISDKLKASAIVDNIVLLNYVEISTLLRRAITVPKARGSKPDQRTREYVIQQGGICLLEDKSVDDIAQVPQLPFSAYYGVLARSPTRKSPIIEETLASGKNLPHSRIPKPGAKIKPKTRASKEKSIRARN
ncbi:MAG: ATPase domain-containing protein [Bdellovibrionota bacterium]